MTDNTTSKNTEIIQITAANNDIGWNPHMGQETIDLLSHLKLPDETSRNRICNEAQRILGKCVPPTSLKGEKTGLIVGYVQSGKTMSFTTVTALACDNRYPMIIIIAGTSKPLFTQSQERLYRDLRLSERNDRGWKPLSNPKPEKLQHIEATLGEWRDNSIPKEDRQTILITVMKNHTHLKNLNQLLSSLDLSGIPVLIIDDEADQAGLNTAVNKGEQSTTYKHLSDIRSHIPHHSYLQYTATPQAPLLINIIDILSPDFAEVLTPGEAYIGGKDFFKKDSNLINTIPDSEIPSIDNVLSLPPNSLQVAMKIFYLGVAAAYVTGKPEGNRSMMVHPSQKTIPHSEYSKWVKSTQSLWIRLLSNPNNKEDYNDILEEFQEAYMNLKITVPNLPSFDVLLEKLPRAIQKTIITEVNSKQKEGTPTINWKNDYSHILVGGQAMDRGFTVEGLTVTYMPRNMGVGNADTVQQRARFFGYKKSYMGFCRVFIEENVRSAFKSYVHHEEDIRRRLIEFSSQNKPLSEWKRAFFLDKSLKPTRKTVLDLSYTQDTFENDWFIQSAPTYSSESVLWNRTIVDKFLKNITFAEDDGHINRTDIQRHLVAENVLLKNVYEDLLISLKIPRPLDSQKFTGVLLQVEQFIRNNNNATCTIYHMSKGKERERSTEKSGVITNLFQGSNSHNNITIYKGDREIRKDNLTIQIHNLHIIGSTMHNIPCIAVWIPKNFSKDWLVQHDSFQAK